MMLIRLSIAIVIAVACLLIGMSREPNPCVYHVSASQGTEPVFIHDAQQAGCVVRNDLP